MALRVARPSTTLFAGRGVLLRALARILDGEGPAEQFLRALLDDAGLVKVPDGREPFVAFVREQVLPRLMPLVRIDRVHELVRRTIGDEDGVHAAPLDSYTAPPGTFSVDKSVRPRVVVVEPDPMRRVGLARSLVRAGFDVEVFARADDALATEPFHALALALDDAGERVVQALAARRTRAGLVVYEDPARKDALRRAIDTWPSDRVAIVARDASASAFCARVRIVVT